MIFILCRTIERWHRANEMPMMELPTNTDMSENSNTTETPANEKASERLTSRNLLCPFCGEAADGPNYEGSSDWVFECKNLTECGARMVFFVSNRTDEGCSDAGALARFIRRHND